MVRPVFKQNTSTCGVLRLPVPYGASPLDLFPSPDSCSFGLSFLKFFITFQQFVVNSQYATNFFSG